MYPKLHLLFDMNVQPVKNPGNFITLKIETKQGKKEISEKRETMWGREQMKFSENLQLIFSETFREKYCFCDRRTQEQTEFLSKKRDRLWRQEKNRA